MSPSADVHPKKHVIVIVIENPVLAIHTITFFNKSETENYEKSPFCINFLSYYQKNISNYVH